ncbi:hypothetical protein SteCoe_13399 [Stentor coeruleus]|uniref:Uncharacterized protein n=1 Tax=Stentor coeruleus TaxID=5963 RepID=A0A1R2C8N1_9CILI|nr:hypothetical protein SteCoe_13399 [Stentor coeruleus]
MQNENPELRKPKPRSISQIPLKTNFHSKQNDSFPKSPLKIKRQSNTHNIKILKRTDSSPFITINPNKSSLIQPYKTVGDIMFEIVRKRTSFISQNILAPPIIITTSNNSFNETTTSTLSNSLGFSKFKRNNTILSRNNSPNTKEENVGIVLKKIPGSFTRSCKKFNEKKNQDAKQSRADLYYLKRKMTKTNCTMSILDFWSNEMMTNASKLIVKPLNNNFKQNVFKFPNLRRKASLPQGRGFCLNYENDFSNYDECIKTITKACEIAHNETVELRKNLYTSYASIREMHKDYKS